MNDTTFKTDFYGVRRVFEDHTSHGIAHGKKDVENLLIACQQWLEEEAAREQSKKDAEKEERRKTYEELKKEFEPAANTSHVYKKYGNYLYKNDAQGRISLERVGHLLYWCLRVHGNLIDSGPCLSSLASRNSLVFAEE